MKLLPQIVFFSVILLAGDLPGKTLIFPPAALPDLIKLGPSRIESRWKPRSVPDGYFPIVEGYYVVYNHENLSLFFGPVDTEREAVTIQAELEETRKYLISKSPSLSTSTVGRIHIDFGGEAPVLQTGTPPPEGFKPVRVLSGNSTLELGKEAETENSSTGSITGDNRSSDYGIGSDTAESGDPSQSPHKEDGSTPEAGTPGSKKPVSGNSEEGDESQTPPTPGTGIIDVFPQGTPSEMKNGVEPPGESPDREAVSDSGPEIPGTSQTTEPTSSTNAGHKVVGDSIGPGDTEINRCPEEQSASGITGGSPQPSLEAVTREPLKSTGAATDSGSSTSPAEVTGDSGMDSENPASQSSPTVPLGTTSTASQPTLPESTGGKSGSEAPESAQTETASSKEAETSEEANTQMDTPDASLDSTNAAAGKPTESYEKQDSSSTEQSVKSSSEESASEEMKKDSEPLKPLSLNTQSAETEKESQENPVEPATESEPASPPPTPASLELEGTIQQSTAPAASLHINQLLKGKLGQPIPSVPPDK